MRIVKFGRVVGAANYYLDTERTTSEIPTFGRIVVAVPLLCLRDPKQAADV
jgi:hypothetical protein